MFPSPAPFFPLPIVMPVFEGVLIKDKLQEFLFRFDLWSRIQNLSSEQKKLCLSFAIRSPTAQSYFWLHRSDLYSQTVSWDQFCSSFLIQCPLDVYDKLRLSDFFQIRQQLNEPTSVFIQRLLYQLDLNDIKILPQTDLLFVDEILNFLPQEAQFYIISKGTPASMNELLDLAKSYDAYKTSRNRTNSSPTLPTTNENFSGTPHPLPLQSSFAVNSPHPSKKPTFCSNCGRSKHRRNRCWSMQRNVL